MAKLIYSTIRQTQAIQAQPAPRTGGLVQIESAQTYSSSQPKAISTWDTLTGQELLTLYGDGAGFAGLAICADGSDLAVADDNGVRVYVLQMDDLLALARRRLTRTWTSAECQRFLHVDVCPNPLDTTTTILG